MILSTNKIHTAQEVEPNIYRIGNKSFNTYQYLVVGKDKAALIDTGYGVGGLRDFIETLTDKPVIVLLTHGHGDHSLGAGEWDEVYMNDLDDSLYDSSTAGANVSKEQRKQTMYNKYRYKGDDFVTYQPSSNFKSINDGHTFDLGKITINAYSLQGHTQGSMVFLLNENRVLITGDAANTATMLVGYGISSYKKNLEAVYEKVNGKFDKIFLSHTTGTVSKELLTDLITLCQAIIEGKDAKIPQPYMGEHVYSAIEINFVDANIYYKEENILK